MAEKYFILQGKPGNVLIDKKDREILYELMCNARKSNAEIGRRVRLSKQSVINRIGRLEKEGVINGYAIGMGILFNLQDHHLYLKLKGKFDHKKILSKLSNIKEVSSMSFGFFSYDIKVNIVLSNSNKMNTIVNSVCAVFDDLVLHKESFSLVTPSYWFSLDYLIKNSEKRRISVNFRLPDKIKLDSKDISIIKALFNSSRTKLIDLSNVLEISHDVINVRLKSLIKQGIISNPFPIIDFKILGLFYADILLSISGNLDEVENILLRFGREKYEVISVCRFVGNYDFCLSFVVDGLDVFGSLLSCLREYLGDHFRDYYVFVHEKDFVFRDNRKNAVDLLKSLN
ncbi:winged helix-turn-helix transcriptional regulator [Candidatus Woesearchaeota archaeon]|nr:winged helix-turn-helix transcriptional regulator [Candidatus Woesearchaeota archaeon]